MSPKHHKKSNAPKFTKHEKLIIMFDSCSAGKDVLWGLSQLARYVEAEEWPVGFGEKKPRIYEKVEFHIPLLVGAETKRKIFVDLLANALSEGDKSALHRFYQKHVKQIKIVETDVSRATTFYALLHTFVEMGESPTIDKEVIEKAEKDMRQDGLVPTERELKNALRALKKKVMHESKIVEEQIDYQSEIIADTHRKLGIRNPKITAEVVDEMRVTQYAEAYRQTFTDEKPISRYIAQALYSHKALGVARDANKEYRAFTKDKGERESESYLFKNGNGDTKTSLTLAVTEDGGMIKGVERLREQSERKVVVLDAYGLALALKKLRIINGVEQIISPKALAAKTETSREDANKWATKFSYAIRYGDWKGIPSKTPLIRGQ